MVEAVEFRSLGRRALHLPPDPHIYRKRDRHDHRNTQSQDEEPPEHPHSTFRIADGQRPECAESHGMMRRAGLSRGQLFFADLSSALRRFSTFFETRSSRLRASFDPVATFSMLAKTSGLFIFSRISFRKG